MKNILTKLFNKSRDDNKIPTDGFKTSREEQFTRKKLIVNPDVAFHKPAYKAIEDMKSKFLDTDYSGLNFEEEIEDFNLKALSPEAKRLIIQIIKEDNKNRKSKIKTYTDSKTVSEKIVPIDLPELPQQYGIDPKTKQIDVFNEYTKDKLITFTEWGNLLEKEEGEKNLKNKEKLLYKLVSTCFPGNTHEENIEFIKQNLKLDEAILTKK